VLSDFVLLSIPHRAEMVASASHPLAARPTVVSIDPLLAPRITPAPSCCEPNELVIELSTTILVEDFARYYPGADILTFTPTYLALPDGSLSTVPFMDDLARSYLSLMVTAILVTLFLRNIIVSFDYICRANMKRRMLFYLLLCSQILSVSYFMSRLSCMQLTPHSSWVSSHYLLLTSARGSTAQRMYLIENLPLQLIRFLNRVMTVASAATGVSLALLVGP
jgi:hypothetical protein